MRLKSTCLALLVSALACLGTAGVATAASSPTATAHGASDIANTAATLNATVTPNGATTNYYFSSGPTASLGTNSPTHSVGVTKSDKGTDVSYRLTGLQSGTTYYYNLTASNSAGNSVTKVVTFKTTGVPPALATTGSANVVSDTTATLNGTIVTNDTNTVYYFEYGPTTAYGSQTSPAIASASTTPSTVTQTLSNLAPGSSTHYRLVVENGPTNTEYGQDASFYTFPVVRPTAKLVQYTTPKHPKRGPYVFTTSGHVINDTATPAADACTGTAQASFYYRGHLLHRLAMPIGSACQFFGKSTFRHLPARGIHSATIQVYVRFFGNHYLKGKLLRAESLTLG